MAASPRPFGFRAPLSLRTLGLRLRLSNAKFKSEIIDVNKKR